jgi:hypothetical protein
MSARRRGNSDQRQQGGCNKSVVGCVFMNDLGKLGDLEMSNPWAFGWTQLLTISGFMITILIAAVGFRSFAR